MSGETLVVGGLIFNDSTPEKTKLKILQALAEALEVELSDIRYDIVSGKWEFQGINWQSGVEAIGIKAFLDHCKGYIKRFVCSLHHLSDPEEINYPDRRKDEENTQQEDEDKDGDWL